MSPPDSSIPVVFFAFNRPATTRRTLEAIKGQQHGPRRIIAYCDGPRGDTDIAPVRAVRALLRDVRWADVEIVERPANLGSAGNILGGLDEVLSQFERVVVLEDDTRPAPAFYESMNVLLDHYADAPQVFSVGGYSNARASSLRHWPHDVLMSPRFSCWGWATWAERWKQIADLPRPLVDPFVSARDVPDVGGSDLQGAWQIIRQRPGAYWDLPIALISLAHGWQHALTRNYLVTNIGTEGGVHGFTSESLRRYRARENRVDSRVPLRFAPPRPDAAAAAEIRAYVAEVARASEETVPGSRMERFWALLARLTSSRGARGAA